MLLLFKFMQCGHYTPQINLDTKIGKISFLLKPTPFYA